MVIHSMQHCMGDSIHTTLPILLSRQTARLLSPGQNRMVISIMERTIACMTANPNQSRMQMATPCVASRTITSLRRSLTHTLLEAHVRRTDLLSLKSLCNMTMLNVGVKLGLMMLSVERNPFGVQMWFPLELFITLPSFYPFSLLSHFMCLLAIPV